MFGFIHRAATTRISPSSWDPNDALPYGSTSIKETLKSPISSLSHVSLAAVGAWSHGTVQFEVRPNVEPPTYDAAVNMTTAQDAKGRGPQLGEGEDFLEVQVEARWNDEVLWKDAEIELRKTGQHDVQLNIVTPSMSAGRLSSQLSFHVTFFFPPSITTLVGLTTTASQWRTIGLPSLSSLLFTTLSISTANAPISFASANARTLRVYDNNGSISGTYIALPSSPDDFSNDGTCDLHTTNAPLTATVQATRVKVYNRNGVVKGSFIAQDRLEVSNANGVVEGDFAGAVGGIEVATSNAVISGTFKVARELVAKTSNAKIDIKVILVGEEDEEARKRESTPPLLEDVKSPEGPGGSAVGWKAKGKVSVRAETSNAKVVVDVVEHPEGLEFDAKAKSSNAQTTLRLRAPYDAHFSLSTSNASVTIDSPADHDVRYQSESKSHREGSVKSSRGSGSDTKNTLVAKTSNAPVLLEIY